jgi:mannan endo-1,4-beta-mannosidase
MFLKSMRLALTAGQRAFLASLPLVAMALTACADSRHSAETSQQPAAASASFVYVDGTQLKIDGAPYPIAGVNFWYGAYLAAPGETGDLDRLRAELDLLAEIGVNNLRILGASEDGPMRDEITPAFQDRQGAYNEQLLQGLDRLLAEMAARDMKAVIYLNNFWEWSGGMGAYLYWTTGEYVDLSDASKPWPAFALHNMNFYANAEANAMFRAYVKMILTRTNSVTGIAYKDDPTIMAWQLANEPRPGYKAAPGEAELPAFYAWIDETAGFIKALAPRQLVSSGNEGLIGCADHPPCFRQAHKTNNIDYLTFHMWPKNWGWLDETNMAGTFERTIANATAYIETHMEDAKALNKPIVLEEFGLPRDGGAIAPETPTVYRDEFYRLVFAKIEDSARADGPLIGSNIWSWGGFGRAVHADGRWRAGDVAYTGDPPQEPQGLNSVFSTDTSTLSILKDHSRQLQAERSLSPQ